MFLPLSYLTFFIGLTVYATPVRVWGGDWRRHSLHLQKFSDLVRRLCSGPLRIPSLTGEKQLLPLGVSYLTGG